MPNQKRPLAFLLGISENLGFAAGNVALGLQKCMPGEDYDVLIYYSTLHDQDRAAFEKIPNVQLVPFEFDTDFSDSMLARIPEGSRFRDMNKLMCLCHFEAFALLSRYKSVVWLDADLGIQGNVKNITSFKPFGITSDSPWTVQENFARPIAGYDMDAPGWCTAVMVVHDELPHENLHKWCYEKAIEYASVLHNPDQGIINLAFQHFHITPSEMPYEVWQCVPRREQAGTALIVHFGDERKVWSDSNVFSAFPEWYRLHKEWLQLGGRDFDQHATMRARNPLTAFDELDILTGTAGRRWSAPTTDSAPSTYGRFYLGTRQLYFRMKFDHAPPGSVRRAGHELLRALGTRAGVVKPMVSTLSSGRPDVAFRLWGGLGDHLIAARYIRDLCAAVGDLKFDLFSSRPQFASWIFANVPNLNNIYNEYLEWHASYREYSLPIHLCEYIYLHLDQADCRRALGKNRALARICESIEYNRYLIAEHLGQQPFTDHTMALQMGLRGWNRYNLAHNMSGLPYGGHRLNLATDPTVLEKHDLLRDPYITVHNASDENFLINGVPMGHRQSTKLYPHFDGVVGLLQAQFPRIKIVHLGAANSRRIPGVDLDLRGMCNIQETAAMLSNSRLHLDVESGLVHLASCLGVKSCVLFGPTSLDYFAYNENVNIPPATCGNCWWLTRDWMMNCAKGYPIQKCLDDVRPVTIVNAIAADLRQATATDTVVRAEMVRKAG
ncbi:MAG TPA: glycosyltransferase family 9 protein [Acetobacteraceae bacterium]|nr:glycosyltransferase family 9 protein [Acetobacteraceae bacterium]